MKCPHCLHAFHDHKESHRFGLDIDGMWSASTCKCANCGRFVIELVFYEKRGVSYVASWHRMIHPKVMSRPPLPEEVPSPYANDYKEAVLVLADSAKASAALSRRCLQHLIHNVIGIKKANLDQEIQAVIDQGKLHSDLLDSLDMVRTTGNFAAHPIKSQSSGEIVEVEPHEAEWNIEVLEMMFDALFVQPAMIKRRRAQLDAKLSDAGKPGLKKS